MYWFLLQVVDTEQRGIIDGFEMESQLIMLSWKER